MIGKIILITGIILFCLLPVVALLEFILKIFRRNRSGLLKLGFNHTELFFTAIYHLLSLAINAALLWLCTTFLPGQQWLQILLIAVAVILVLNFILFLNHLFHELRRTVLYDPGQQLIIVERSRQRVVVDLKDRQWQIVHYSARYRKAGSINIPGASLGKTVISKGPVRISFSHLLLQYHELHLVLQQREGLRRISRPISFIR